MWYLTKYIKFPFERLILQIPLELELIVFEFSHNVKIGKKSMSYILNI
jgi:hypothetical protein